MPVTNEDQRVSMVQMINCALAKMPGDLKKEKALHLARRLGVPARRIEEYYRNNQVIPTAAESENLKRLIVQMHTLRLQADATSRFLGAMRKRYARIERIDPISANCSLDPAGGAGERPDRAGARPDRTVHQGAAFAGSRDHGDARVQESAPQPGDLARELGALRGAVEINEELGLDTVSAEQVKILDAWRDSGGDLTDTLIHTIEAIGLGGLTSAVDSQMRVMRIGACVGLWSDADRQRAVGRDLGELPAPMSYRQAVREALSNAWQNAKPTHHRLSVRVGDIAKVYRRCALPLPGPGLILSVSMIEASC